MTDIIEVPNEIKGELSLTGGDIQRVADHLKLVKEAVSKVMTEGINNDFAEIPGTRKKCLLKPGAEKLMRLFGLGVRFKKIENIFDRFENFAMYSYEAEIYHLRTGTVIASCEGTANSQEQKYKEKKQYQNNVVVGMVPIPVPDIVNTLKKMAQKRAMVGAVIIAVGASDYFSQDEDEVQEQKPVYKKPEKVDADRFGGDSGAGEYKVTFGKFNGKKIKDIKSDELSSYLDYVTSRNPNPDGPLSELINNAREFLRQGAA